MWRVEFEDVKVEVEVKGMIKKRLLSPSDQALIHAWIQQVSLHGPESISEDQKWADHALENDWEGYRSSSFSNRGRIIYRVQEKLILIQIARITVKHNYKK